jgi:hypothetical protein
MTWLLCLDRTVHEIPQDAPARGGGRLRSACGVEVYPLAVGKAAHQRWCPACRCRQSFADASPAEVRAALIPEEAVEFEREWRRALAGAAETLELAEVEETLESWRRVARLTAAAGAERHRAMYRRAATRLTGTDIPTDEPVARTKARLGW